MKILARMDEKVRPLSDLSGLSLLLKLRIKPLGRLFSSSGSMDSRKRLQYVASAFFGVIFFSVVLAFSTSLFGSILSGGQEGREVAVGALRSLSNVAVVLLLVPAFSTAFYTVYLARELDFLAAMPIRESAILSYKFWETLFSSVTLYAMFILPALAAYGLVAPSSLGAVLLYYPVLLLVSVLLAMVPVGIGIIVLMPVMRLVPTGRLKELLAVVALLFVITFYFVFFRLSGNATESGTGAVSSVVASLRPLLESPLARIPPGTWAADALSGAASLQWVNLFSGLAPLALLSTAIYASCLIVARWAYATGRSQAAESGGRVRPATGRRGTAGSLFRKLLAPLPPEARAVAAKELKLLPRDLQRLVSVVFITLIVSGGVLGNLVVDPPELPASGPEALLPYLAAGALGTVAAGAFSMQSVGIEGRFYWFIISSPVVPARLLMGKWASTLPLAAAASLAGSVAIAIFAGALSAITIAGILAGTAAGMLGGAILGLYGVGLAAMFARFDSENPAQATAGAGTFFMFLCGFGLAVLAVVSGSVAVVLSQVAAVWISVICGALLWMIVGAIGGYKVAAAGMASLERMEWDL